VRFPLLPPEKTRFGEIAVSPDGHRVAFTTRDAAGNSQLWVRPLDALAAQALGGTEGANLPFWSPDSRWIGFFAKDKLKKVEISGGRRRRSRTRLPAAGAAWNRDW
jgi:Tol biopolymer transport system component